MPEPDATIHNNPGLFLIYGSKGQGLAMLVEAEYYHSRVVGFIDDYVPSHEHPHARVPVRSYEEWRDTPLPILLSMGDPRARRVLAARIDADGGAHARFMPPRLAVPWANIVCGTGTCVSHFANICPNVRIGQHVLCLSHVHVGHDVVVGDFVTLCPGCIISGHVVIEDDCFIGAGAVISNGTEERPLVIGRGSVIAAGAVVMKSVAPGSRMIGNPAVTVREHVRRLGASGGRNAAQDP